MRRSFTVSQLRKLDAMDHEECNEHLKTLAACGRARSPNLIHWKTYVRRPNENSP